MIKRKEIFKIAAGLLILLLLVACTGPQSSDDETGKNVLIKQVEPSQVVLPQVGQAVGPLEVEGNVEGSFLAQIMNQMVAKLKGNASSE